MSEEYTLAAAVVRCANSLSRDAVMHAFTAYFSGREGFDRDTFILDCKKED